MIKTHNRKAVPCIALAMMTLIALCCCQSMGPVLKNIIRAVSLFSWIGGCLFFAKAKGYNWVIGFLGLLSILGFLVLACLPDKSARKLTTKDYVLAAIKIFAILLLILVLLAPALLRVVN